MAETKSPFDTLGGIAATGGIGAAIGAGSELIGGLIQQAFAKRNLRRQVRAQKELTEFNVQKQYEMMLNEMRLKKMGLKQAGISTATMNGDFGGNAAVPTQSAGMPQTPNINIDALGAISQLSSVKDIEASARLKNAEAENKEIENEFAREKYEADAGIAHTNWNLAKQTFDANVSAATEYVLNMKSTREFTDKQKEQAAKNIEKMSQEISGIQIDNQSKNLHLLVDKATSADTINRIQAEAKIAMNTRDVSNLKATLAEFGIIWDSEPLNNFLYLLAQGKADDILNKMAEGFGQLIGAIPGALINALIGLWEGGDDAGNSGSDDSPVKLGSKAGKATRDFLIDWWKNGRKNIKPSTQPKF